MIVDSTNDNKDKVPIKCLCGKRIADRDDRYIYIYCKKCKKLHKYQLAE